MPEHFYPDGTPIHVGDIVRRGKGKTVWRVERLIDWQGEPMVALASTTGYTNASVMSDGIATLTRLETTKDPHMTITVDRQQLAAAVGLVAQAIPSRPTHLQQAAVTFLPEDAQPGSEDGGRQLRLIAANYELQLETRIPASWQDPTPIVMPGRLVAEWLKAERGETVQITVEDGEIELRGRRVLLVPAPTVDPHEHISYDSDTTRHAVTGIGRDLLADALKRVGGAIGRDEFLPALTGVHLHASGDRLVLSATDRYKMAQVELDLTGPESVVQAEFEALPRHRDMVALLAHMGERIDLVREGGVLWIFDDRGSAARIGLLDENFPKIGHLITAEREYATVVGVAELRAELQVAGQLIRLSTAAKTAKVRLATSPSGGLEVRLIDERMTGLGMPIPCEGDRLDVDVNPTYLLSALDVVGSVEQVTIGHFGPGGTKPLRLDSPDSTGVGVVMPMRR